MPDVGFSDANSFSAGPYYFATKAVCPTHGEVGGDFQCFVMAEPSYSTGKICPKCYVDWVRANVQSVTAKGLSEASGRDKTP